MDLRLTMESGQTSGVWFREDGGYVKPVDGELVRMETSGGGRFLEVTGGLPEGRLREVAERAATVGYPFEGFLEAAACDPELGEAADGRRGLRLTCSVEPFEGLISSILSQNTSVERWRQVNREVSERFGGEARGYPEFPSPRELVEASEDDLRDCGAGYRAPYVEAAAEWAAGGGMEEVLGMSTGEAREVLRGLTGVGPKVADCVLLYGLRRFEVAPIDIHMKRRVGGEGYEDCSEEMQGFGRHAGLAQLYLYDYERRG